MAEDLVLKYSSLQLAYLGDAVYELLVRSYLLKEENLPTSHALQRRSLSFVKASEQAKLCRLLLPLLTEEETGVVSRGKNAKPHHMPKGVSNREYREATALEALFGYLHLTGAENRLNELFQAGRKALCENTETEEEAPK